MSRLTTHLHLLGLTEQTPELTLEDSFGAVTLQAARGGVSLDGRPLPTHRALLEALTPRAGLNRLPLLRGTLLTPVGVLSFCMEERTPKFTSDLVPCLTLISRPGQSVAAGAQKYDWVQLVWQASPVGNHGLPVMCTRHREPGIAPTPGVAAMLYRLREQARDALMTPHALHALRRETLLTRLQAAQEREAAAEATCERWQAEIVRQTPGAA